MSNYYINLPIHKVEYASQPDIQFLCDQSWSTPWWDVGGLTATPDVYIADDNRLYTFTNSLVTCETCKRLQSSKI